ncbi:MAG: cyclopropane-fatty-acyl-phospholipid synthase family protein [Saprospiraceae bacterium]
MTNEQFAEGLAYAEENFRDDHAPHLHVDKKLIKSKFDLTGKKILDFGCGMGGMSLWYATNWDCKVVGLDIDAHHVKIANTLKEKYKVDNATFVQKNILDRPFTEKFDMIFLNDVAEHIQFDILQPIMVELRNVLATHGQIFVTYPPWKSPYASHVSHVTKIPWCQFLPNSMLIPMIEKNNRVIVGDLEGDLVEAYKGLNHLTHKKLSPIVKKAGLSPVFRKSHSVINRFGGPLKNLNLRIPPFDYLVTKEFLLLEHTDKRAVEQSQSAMTQQA